MLRLSVRIDLPNGRVGPGKVTLLEAVAQTGSISGAARSIGMSYRRAWILIDELNGIFEEPVLSTQAGGKSGGGAALTRLGRDIVDRYRAIEHQALRAAAADLEALRSAVRDRPAPDGGAA